MFSIPLLPVFVFMAVTFVLGIVQYGRRGPRVGWYPRRMRARVNERFARSGWPKPYDEDGNKIQPLWARRSKD
jgi:hypothetical protein